MVCDLQNDETHLAARGPIIHEIKCVQPYYDAIAGGSKNFELRIYDRDYRVGDVLIINEIDDREHRTGKSVSRNITYILEHFDGLMPGWCIMGLRR